MELKKNTPIYFKKRVQTEDTLPDAQYVRFMGQIPNGEAHEIYWHSEKWIVGRDQFRTLQEAFSDAAIRHDADIKKAKINNPTEPHKALGISKTTLKKRMKFVQQHLVNGDSPKAVQEEAL